jgi:hypothetical protein
MEVVKRKGRERKGKERKGKEGKGRERKGFIQGHCWSEATLRII